MTGRIFASRREISPVGDLVYLYHGSVDVIGIFAPPVAYLIYGLYYLFIGYA